jgi:hypothetical protein
MASPLCLLRVVCLTSTEQWPCQVPPDTFYVLFFKYIETAAKQRRRNDEVPKVPPSTLILCSQAGANGNYLFLSAA